MKKRIALLLALLTVALLFVGCGSKFRLEKGAWNGNTYTNQYAEVTFQQPAGWVAGSDEDLAQMMNITADTLKDSGEYYSDKLLELGVIFDMMSTDAATGSNVIIQYYNLDLLGDISEKEFLTEATKQFDTMSNYEKGAIGSGSIAGKSYTTITLNETTIGADQHMYARKKDKVLIVILVTVVGGTPTEDIMSCFQ